MLSNWYTKKSWSSSDAGFPVKDPNDARQIEKDLKDGAIYKKHFVGLGNAEQTMPSDEGHKRLYMTASTDDVDYDGDVMCIKGLDMSRYRKQPSICWNHNYDIPPIGHSLSEKVIGNAVKSLAQFAKRPADWPADEVFISDEIHNLVVDNVIRGVSIGMLIHEVELVTKGMKDENPALKDARRLIKRATLYEISLVPIACNSSCLIEAVTKGKYKKDIYGMFNLDMPDNVWSFDTNDYFEEKATRLDILNKLRR